MPILLPAEVRTYIHDAVPNNYLLDTEEFSDPIILLAMKMAVSSYNALPPFTGFNEDSFPDYSTLMLGTLYHLFLGRAAFKARNHMSYSDGGLQIPVEEQFPLYTQLSEMFYTQFMQAATRLKAHQNIESGWGIVPSDYAAFPLY